MRGKIIYFLVVAMILLSIPSNKALAAEINFVNDGQVATFSSIQPRELLTYKKNAWTEDSKIQVEATITVQGSSMTIIGIRDAKWSLAKGEINNISVGPAVIRSGGAYATVTVTYEDTKGNVYTSVAYIYP